MSATLLKIERKTARCTATEARELFAAIPAKAQRSQPGHALATIIDALSAVGTADLAASLARLFPDEPLDKARRRLTTEIANRVYVDETGTAPLKIVQTRKGIEPALIWLERLDVADVRGLTEAGPRYAPDQFVPAEATQKTSAEIVVDIVTERAEIGESAADATTSDNDTPRPAEVPRAPANPTFVAASNHVKFNKAKSNNAANDSLRGSKVTDDEFTPTDALPAEGFSGFTESAPTDSKNTVNALDAMLAWAADSAPTSPKLLALLGDYGTGKTSHALQFSRVLNGDVAHPNRPDVTLSALHIDLAYLRGVQGLAHLNVTQIVAIVIEARGLNSVLSAEVVVREVREGRRILVYDGLDELMQSDHAQLHSVFRQLLQVLEPDPVTRAPSRARLIVSCRTHYFRDLTEQHEFFNTRLRHSVTRKDYLCLYLLPWKLATVRDYLNRRLTPVEASALAETITTTYNLEELASRPVLLAMMCEQVGEVLRLRDAGGGAVTASTLYAQTVAMWVRRDDEKHVLQATHKPVLMGALACAMWNDEKEYWEADRLDRWLRKTVDTLFPGHYSPEQTQAIQDDLRTATFIVRPGQQGFTFAHRSFMEFFLARHVWTIVDRSDLSDGEKQSLLPLRYTGIQVAKFFKELLLTRQSRADASIDSFWFLLQQKAQRAEPKTKAEQTPAPACNLALLLLALDADLPLSTSTESVNLRSIRMESLRWERRKLPSLDLTKAKLVDVFVNRCHFGGVKFAGATFTRVSMIDCEFDVGHEPLAHADGLFVRYRSDEPSPTRIAGPWSEPRSEIEHLIERRQLAHRRSMSSGGMTIGPFPTYCSAGAVSNSRKFAVTADSNGWIALWDIDSGKIKWNRTPRRFIWPAQLVISANDKLFAVIDENEWIVADCETGTLMGSNVSWLVPQASPALLEQTTQFNVALYQRLLKEYLHNPLTARTQARSRRRVPHNTPIIVGELHEAGLKIEFDANAAYVKFERDGEILTRVFVHGAKERHSTACFDAEGRLVDYDEEAADTWLRYMGNGYPQPVEAAWLELDEMGRSLGPKKMPD